MDRNGLLSLEKGTFLVLPLPFLWNIFMALIIQRKEKLRRINGIILFGLPDLYSLLPDVTRFDL